jgi:sec-independent protein translocase protein TatB
MFDFDAGKLIVFAIVALAVIPPKDLPRVLRTVGKYVGMMRRMASDFQGQFMEAIKETELDSVRKEIEEIGQAAKVEASFDPVAMTREHLEAAVENKPAAPVPETAAIEAPVAAEALHTQEKAASNAT